MLKGYLEAQDISIGEHKVSRSLQRVAPTAYEHRRQNTLETANPIPYTARHFGHKLHIDQNEKIGMYGVTHVISVDGFSNYVTSFISMPVKNNLVIYDSIYR